MSLKHAKRVIEANYRFGIQCVVSDSQRRSYSCIGYSLRLCKRPHTLQTICCVLSRPEDDIYMIRQLRRDVLLELVCPMSQLLVPPRQLCRVLFRLDALYTHSFQFAEFRIDSLLTDRCGRGDLCLKHEDLFVRLGCLRLQLLR